MKNSYAQDISPHKSQDATAYSAASFKPQIALIKFCLRSSRATVLMLRAGHGYYTNYY